MRRAIVLVAVLMVAGCSDGAPSGAPAAARSANPFRIGRTLVIPHAGGDGMFPEDTLFAYEQTIPRWGDVVDVDVRLAADGVPVAIHDPTVDRTTDGKGAVADLTSAELQQLDAGYRFELRGAFPFRGKGVTVPTLEEILRRFPTTLTTLDLKDQRVALVAPLCALIRRLGRAGDLYVGIDVDEQVIAFREQCPEVRTSGTSEERRIARAARESGDPKYTTNQLVSQPPLQRDDGTRVITAGYLAFSHRFDTAVMAYVIDDLPLMRELVALGVDGIYTRYPDRLATVVGRNG